MDKLNLIFLKKIIGAGLFAVAIGGFLSADFAMAARDDSALINRNASENLARNTNQKSATVARGAVRNTVSSNSNREITARSATPMAVQSRAAVNDKIKTSRAETTNAATAPTINRAAGNIPATKTTVARATDTKTTAISETRTGAEYEKCKTSYFSCMDQFCRLKNDDYRRCSCSNRVYEFDDARTVMNDAGTKLTEFTESLDAVGMTAAQATAMRNSSEGENALTSDGSASKALLQAIMNSIRGGDSNVGGKFNDLNSINISFNTANAFGITDSGQAMAAYNGENLYNAIYGQCRNAVRTDCNDASLQRAVTAYLMAVEQDCNTVETSINENKKKMTAAVREGSAMLDLARIENRQKHNSEDMSICLSNVEKAILSEEVCGAGYHKCLDNGEFIDLTTGAPIAGVVRFYELENLLKFNMGATIADQKLSMISSNRTFVQNFEKRVKKFAAPALDKCTESADTVWADYLDRAMLDIFYAQKSKVSEIKKGCFDFVSACYVNGDNALTNAMTELAGDPGIILQPDKISLNSAVCSEYVQSCDKMFDDNIVQQYIDNRKDTDTLTACRAVAKQCFDKFGGSGYENLYYPFSGLFNPGEALDWFTLCKDKECTEYKSQCAKQLQKIPSCASHDMVVQAFGGMDYFPIKTEAIGTTDVKKIYYKDGIPEYGTENSAGTWDSRVPRASGVATEVYYQILDTLGTQCNNVQGRFVELQFLKTDMYNKDNICKANFTASVAGDYANLAPLYGVSTGEDLCPRGYGLEVDIKSWGVCSCWENGARRSRGGTSVKCMQEMPSATGTINGASCPTSTLNPPLSSSTPPTPAWCTATVISDMYQVCPMITTKKTEGECDIPNNPDESKKIPKGMN